MILEIENGPIMMLVDFRVLSGSKDYVDDGQWYPGNDPEINIDHVFVGHSNGRMDILNALSMSEVNALEKICWREIE